MPFNGSGSFSPVYNWTNDANNGIKILASRQDTQWSDACTNGLSNCVTRDGQSPATANIPMGTFKIINLGNGTAATDAAAYGQLQTAQGAFTGFIGGLKLSAAGSTGTFGIAAGCATDSTSAGLMTLASAFTKTTANFVAGTGNGALDTGSIANTTWYHVFIIGDPALPGDILFSLSPTSPALPSGYTIFRRIGSMLTDSSSHWVAFIQNGNNFRWKTAVFGDFSNTLSGRQAVALTVPTGVIVFPDITLIMTADSSGSGQGFLMTSLDETDSTVTTTQNTIWIVNADSGGTYGLNSITTLHTNTSAQVGARASASGSVLTITTNGWTDLRGSQ